MCVQLSRHDIPLKPLPVKGRRDDLGGDPLLEGLGLGLAAAQDEGVEARFVDNVALGTTLH